MNSHLSSPLPSFSSVVVHCGPGNGAPNEFQEPCSEISWRSMWLNVAISSPTSWVGIPMNTTCPPGPARRTARLAVGRMACRLDDQVTRGHDRPRPVAQEGMRRTGFARLFQLLFRHIHRNDGGCPHQAHPLYREQPDRAAADDTAGLADGQRSLPDRVQRDRGGIRHGGGARVDAGRRLQQVAARDRHVFGIGTIAAAAEIVIVPATREAAGQALVASAAGDQRRDRDQFALPTSRRHRRPVRRCVRRTHARR